MSAGDKAGKKDLRELDERRAAFIAGVSHDLKTPLNGIIGFTSVLMMDAAGKNPEQEKKLKLVFESANLMLERINALVRFHRLEAGVILPEPDWLMPADLMLQAAESLRPAAEEAGLRLVVQPGGPTRIHSDLGLLASALREILSNALRFSREGEIRLTAALEQGGDGSGKQLCFSVSDEGIGFSEENLQILRRGLRPEEPGDQFQGLGLGLALARLAAESLNAWLEVESVVQQGSTFRLCLPLEPAQIEE